ncbi:four helix bundle protein [Alienimonas sp. DA493]|uniref:four helix bundle protein n=1 Tax=Alienimonas sp. DA493 TaxID=3373605 RepID=UPI00375507D4
MQIFELSKTFPQEERYSLTGQIRRSSRSVCANITEGWRKRRYPASFVSKMNDAEGEAAETQTWLHFAVNCKYVTAEAGRELYEAEESVIRLLVAMQNDPDRWTRPR